MSYKMEAIGFQYMIFFSAFVACFNEERRIFESLVKIEKALSLFGKSFEIIVIDDASNDNSEKSILRFLKKSHCKNIIFKRNGINKGLGFNYVEASFMAKGKYFRFFSGDDVESSQEILKLLRHIGQADIVIPYFNYKQFKRGLIRDTLSKIYNSLCRIASGHNIRYFNGSIIVKTQDVRRWHSYSRGFGFQADFLGRLLDLKRSYVEVQVLPLKDQKNKSHAFLFRNIVSVIFNLLEIFQRRMIKYIYNNIYKNWSYFDS